MQSAVVFQGRSQERALQTHMHINHTKNTTLYYPNAVRRADKKRLFPTRLLTCTMSLLDTLSESELSALLLHSRNSKVVDDVTSLMFVEMCFALVDSVVGVVVEKSRRSKPPF